MNTFSLRVFYKGEFHTVEVHGGRNRRKEILEKIAINSLKNTEEISRERKSQRVLVELEYLAGLESAAGC